MKKTFLLFVLAALFMSCSPEKNGTTKTENKIQKKQEEKLFTSIPSSFSNINFSNNIQENRKFNFLSYPYIYNGGGVSSGDINNDGLQDLYFTSNQESNKLYLNQGNFQFRDITNTAGVEDKSGWTTGTSMIDINCDGWMDIYVCKSASLRNNDLRRNLLYINQGNDTFIESAKQWGLDDPGFSVQSYFFDMDKDGDLDMFLVNHRSDFKNNGSIRPDLQNEIIPEFSDQLYRNEGDHFVNITSSSGVANRAWGLSASIGDFNGDNWPDIYVCNDFIEPDYLYLNKQDGTFTNGVDSAMRHIAFNSMGSDYADINNDLLPDLAVLDMTPSDHIRSKSNMANMSTADFNKIVDVGFHHQYMFNMLQLNNGPASYSEIGQLAGIAKTDWSWAPLLADFDNDGYKDLLITNGILKDLSNRDFQNMIKRKTANREKMALGDLIQMMPSKKLNNALFLNQGDLSFKDKATSSGMNIPSFSNGAAYTDLDNDGDLDIVINNTQSPAFLYKNNSTNNFLQLKIKGSPKNPLGIGAKVTLIQNGSKQYSELYLNRGFQSSMHDKINFGLSESGHIDSLIITWTEGQTSALTDLEPNQTIEVSYGDFKQQFPESQDKSPLLTEIDPAQIGIHFTHQENTFDDYALQVLLPHSQSRHGPFIEKADVNQDGLDDFFIGGAANQGGVLFIQQPGDAFKKITKPFDADKANEDLGMVFFDYDQDGDEDLYIVSGGAEFPIGSTLLQDRLYKNDGKGNFKKTNNVLPKINQSGMVVESGDLDQDGDLDLFVGGRIIPNQYPFAPKSYLLINENGKFEATENGLESLGMTTGASFSDTDQDGDLDLLVVGEWSNIILLENKDGALSPKNLPEFENTTGLWFSLNPMDVDKDGDEDFILGNLSKNSKFKVNDHSEFHIFCDDFDENGTYDIILSNKYQNQLVPVRGRQCTSEQMPSVADDFPNYNLFANASLNDILGEENLSTALHYEADILDNCYLQNNDGQSFTLTTLPNFGQVSPILNAKSINLDKDGSDEIILIGNNYNTETETIRQDASIGGIISNNNGKFTNYHSQNTGLKTVGDSRDLVVLNEKYIVIVTNDAGLNVFQINR